MKDIVLVRPESGDWEALYMDDVLVAEGHSLRASDVLDAIANVFPHKFSSKEISDDLAEQGFGRNLSDML